MTITTQKYINFKHLKSAFFKPATFHILTRCGALKMNDYSI